MIKSFFINAFIVFITLFFCAIALPIAIFDPTGIRVHSYIAVLWAKVIIWISGVSVDVHGIENLDPTRPRSGPVPSPPRGVGSSRFPGWDFSWTKFH